ncbi:MAG: hypothetical protein ACOVOV_15745, partial [Dolichospermum sp.]
SANDVGLASGLPNGVSAFFSNNTVTISGTPTESGVFSYSIPLLGGCGVVAATGTISVEPNMYASPASSSPRLCVNTQLAPITHSTINVTSIGTPIGLPPGITALFENNIITISGTPTSVGTFNYSIPLAGSCGSLSNAIGTITVISSMTVGSGSSRTLCINTGLNPITHSTSGAVGIGVPSGLPSGVSATWASNSITISGIPTEAGVFTYSIPLIGECGSVFATGTITVNPNGTVSTASSSPTLCVNTALLPITHTTTGVNGIYPATGLPLGVTATYSSTTKLITIAGTPTVSGIFNYSIQLLGATCGNLVTATGTITVNPSMTVTVASSSPTLCVNTDLTPITHTTTGATG